MKFQSLMNSLSNVETGLIVVFIFYLAMPIQLPDVLSNMVESSLGTVAIFGLSIYLFFNANPLVAVLFVMVAYELFHRCCNATGKVAMLKYTPTQARKDNKMKSMNPTASVSLEEQIVDELAPIGKSDISVFTSSTFKPVSENTGSASIY